MSRATLYVLIALVGTGCQPRLEQQKTYSVASEFQPYVDLFVVEAKNQHRYLNIDDLIVEFTDSLNNSTTLGQAITAPRATPRIRINASSWAYLVNADREQLMFHELAHAILGRDHNDYFCNYGGYIVECSVMSSYQFSSGRYQMFRSYYMSELFNGSK
jgi:hypothetical protein